MKKKFYTLLAIFGAWVPIAKEYPPEGKLVLLSPVDKYGFRKFPVVGSYEGGMFKDARIGMENVFTSGNVEEGGSIVTHWHRLPLPFRR